MTAAPAPRFSVIIPVLNRAAMISRAIDSALAQVSTYDNFEIIVVDDGSTDGTSDVVSGYADPRVRLLRHPQNRGVCAARNTGIDQATGTWCVFLDSDFELLPFALRDLAAHCLRAPSDVGNMASACEWDHGGVTPDPMPAEGVMTWPEYLRFVSGLRTSEWFNCIRREVFEHIRYPEGRAYEGGFHLRVARRHRFSFTRDCFVRIHTDAVDRITVAPPDRAVRRMLRDAKDCAADAERVLRDFGDDMRAYAPGMLRHYTEIAALQNLLSGQRARALKHYAALGRGGVSSVRSAGILTLGMLGPGALSRAMAHWTWRRRRA